MTDRLRFPTPTHTAEPPAPFFEDFVGSEACAECHPQVYRVWRNSTHGRAGGRPDTETVIGPFDGTPLEFRDAVVVPTVGEGQRFLFRVTREGESEETLEVDAVIGGGHLNGGGTQSYFSEFPDGTYRFLPFDFIREESVWFVQVRDGNQWLPVDKTLSLNDLSEWPPSRLLGTAAGFTNCQNCHASQLQVRYDSRKQRYVTRFKSLEINCESCHGPGRRHVQLAKSGRMGNLEEIGMRPLSTLTKDESLMICFQCHAVKDPLDDDYLPGSELEDHYSLKLPILAESPYLADGRVRAFAYQQNHLYSDCYLNGSMTCVDCHDPHAQTYRDIYGKELEGRFDNGQCLGCHASKRRSPERHTHHESESPGSRCTSCHMPYLQHRSVGTQLRFARADHSIPIPRPAHDDSMGIENACKKCHPDRTIPWLEAKTAEWYGELKPHKEVVTGLLQRGRATDRKSASRLLLHPGARHPMAQVAGLSTFIKRWLEPDMPDLEPEIVQRLEELSREPDIDLRSLALMSLHFALGHRSEIASFLRAELHTLEVKQVAARTRWAMGLDYLGTLYAGRGDYGRAIRAHTKATEIKPDDAVAFVNLGNAYGNSGDLDRAITAFQTAIELDPDNPKALANLGIAYARKGDVATALRSYQEAVRLRPSDAANRLLLSRFYLNIGDIDGAAETVEVGLKLAPHDRRLKEVWREIESLRQGVPAPE